MKIIEDFQALPNLWDVSFGDYKNRNKRNDAMEHLALNTELSIEMFAPTIQ